MLSRFALGNLRGCEEFFRGAATHDATGDQDTRDIEPVVRHVPVPHDYESY